MGSCRGFYGGCSCRRCLGIDEEGYQRLMDTFGELREEFEQIGCLPDEHEPPYDQDHHYMNHPEECYCGDCLDALARDGFTSEELRRNVTTVTQADVDEVVRGCEALLASPRAKFVEWCRENGKE